jgi:hypothetical protein
MWVWFSVTLHHHYLFNTRHVAIVNGDRRPKTRRNGFGFLLSGTSWANALAGALDLG